MHRLVLASFFFSIISIAIGCGSLSDDLRLCGEIPRGGCPLGRGGSCDDTACAGLYDCVEGSWTLAVSCPGGGGGGAGGGAGTGQGGEGGACMPVALDHTGEKKDCMPDLESPDCPAAAAETCAACLTECSDFFLCTQDGWTLVAFCDDDAGLTVVQ